MNRTVEPSPDKETALTNLVYVSPDDELLCTCNFVEAGGHIFSVVAHRRVSNGSIAFGNVHRKMLKVAVRDVQPVSPFSAKNVINAGEIHCEISYFHASQVCTIELPSSVLVSRITELFEGQIFGVQQQATFDLDGQVYNIRITRIFSRHESKELQRGLFQKQTAFVFTNKEDNPVKITDDGVKYRLVNAFHDLKTEILKLNKCCQEMQNDLTIVRRKLDSIVSRMSA